MPPTALMTIMDRFLSFITKRKESIDQRQLRTTLNGPVQGLVRLSKSESCSCSRNAVHFELGLPRPGFEPASAGLSAFEVWEHS